MKNYFLNFRIGEKAQSLESFVQSVKSPKPILQKNWVAYVSHRRYDNWKRLVRARTQIVLVHKDIANPHLKIAYQDKNLIVLDKPTGLPTQKTLKKNETNLFEQVQIHFVLEKKFPVGLPYVGLHHRLDRDTSGLVLMTKQRSANKEVSLLFKDRKIKKTYLAKTEWVREIKKKKWIEKGSIARSPKKNQPFFFQVKKEGQSAQTEFEWVESCEDQWHLFKCYPKTGRTHQIRVHLAHCGFPVLGDRLYGNKESAPRLMLHAQALEFKFKGETIHVHSDGARLLSL